MSDSAPGGGPSWSSPAVETSDETSLSLTIVSAAPHPTGRYQILLLLLLLLAAVKKMTLLREDHVGRLTAAEYRDVVAGRLGFLERPASAAGADPQLRCGSARLTSFSQHAVETRPVRAADPTSRGLRSARRSEKNGKGCRKAGIPRRRRRHRQGHPRRLPRGDVGVSGESARILARKSVSVSAPWNASLSHPERRVNEPGEVIVSP